MSSPSDNNSPENAIFSQNQAQAQSSLASLPQHDIHGPLGFFGNLDDITPPPDPPETTTYLPNIPNPNQYSMAAPYYPNHLLVPRAVYEYESPIQSIKNKLNELENITKYREKYQFYLDEFSPSRLVGYSKQEEENICLSKIKFLFVFFLLLEYFLNDLM